jgi:hypothetical protein
MFFKNMEQVSIEVDESNGYIHIKQANIESQNEENIMITPDQIDGLISWLQEAKAYAAGLNSKT